MQSIIRSIDVGYGNTKYTTNNLITDSSYSLFPSWAIPEKNNVIEGGSVKKRNTVVISIREQNYEVGPSIERAIEHNATRPLHSNYVSSPEYQALNLGAIHYINEKNIDFLTVGLPVNYMNSKADDITNLLAGKHIIEDKVININQVKVVPQPLGGFLDYALSHSLYGSLRQKTILVIDIGYYTTDWITTTGLNIKDSRSASFEGGMSALLKPIASTISKATGTNLVNLNNIDLALRSKRLFVDGSIYDPNEFLVSTTPYIDKTIHAINDSIGSYEDIEEIVLIGGGAPYFYSSIQKHFPKRRIHTVNNSIFANLRGFQRIGIQSCRS